MNISLPPTRTHADVWRCLACFQFPLIYIETPLGTRVAQWNDEAGQNGLLQLEFQLSEEPTLVREDLPDGRSGTTFKAVMMKTIQAHSTEGYEDNVAVSSFCTFNEIQHTSFEAEAK